MIIICLPFKLDCHYDNNILAEIQNHYFLGAVVRVVQLVGTMCQMENIFVTTALTISIEGLALLFSLFQMDI